MFLEIYGISIPDFVFQIKNELNLVQRSSIHIKSVNEQQLSYTQNLKQNKINVPTYCPKCGSMISLVENDGKQVVGCSRYPECDYIIME